MSAARFPFSAVVGHDDLRLALLLNAVHPGVGGVLVRGEKGTAKSTAVRALSALLPDVEVVVGCRFGCDPAAPDPSCPDGPHRPGRATTPGNTTTGRGAAAPDAATAARLGTLPPGPSTPSGGALADSVRAGDEDLFALDHEDENPYDPPAEQVPSRPVGVRRSARLVELPVGATEDRLVGSLDLERALSAGESRYRPGLLAEAHRGVLYVDEVNLLHDHLVDLLLDAAAMGRAHVERDGVSVQHAARFLLVGTMNPEEGELRPQLLDRFGLTVEVRASRDVGTRTEVMRRRIAFDDDPAGFVASFADAEADVARRIADAQARVGSVRVDDRELRRIAAVCAWFDVDGMRADLVMARAAAAHAAWRGADAVEEQDVRVAARLALPHRRRRDPFDEPGLEEKDLDEAMRDAAEQLDDDLDPTPPDGGTPESEDQDADADAADAAPPDGPGSDGPNAAAEPPGGTNGALDQPDGADGAVDRPASDAGAQQPGAEQPDETGRWGGDGGDGRVIALGAAARIRPSAARRFTVPGLGAGAPGRRSRARTDTGRVTRPTDGATTRAADLHVPATVAAAAPHQVARGRTGAGLVLARGDLRRAEREGREGNLVLFVVDASGSMAARKRMTAVSGAVLGLLRDAYQRRDKVGLVTFRASGAEVALPPTSSVPTAQTRLARLRTGGRTPLADGLLRARAVLAVERLRDPKRRPLLVLLTDGRATVAARPGSDASVDARRAAGLLGADGTHTVVVDCESGPVRLGLAGPLAAAAGGSVVTLDELTADGVGDVVRAARAA